MAVEECSPHHTAPDIHHVMLFTMYTKCCHFHTCHFCHASGYTVTSFVQSRCI